MSCDVEELLPPMVLSPQETSNITMFSNENEISDVGLFNGGPGSLQGNQKYDSEASVKCHFQQQQLDHGMFCKFLTKTHIILNSCIVLELVIIFHDIIIGNLLFYFASCLNNYSMIQEVAILNKLRIQVS